MLKVLHSREIFTARADQCISIQSTSALIIAQQRSTRAMAHLLQLQKSVSVMRKELQNLRRQVVSLTHVLKSETLSIKRRFSSLQEKQHRPDSVPRDSAGATTRVLSSETREKMPSLISSLSNSAIGRARTCFREKNGTPRQPGLCPSSQGSIKIETFTNPSHSLEGLEDFSHAWLLFVFHDNRQDRVKAKVKPPRLGGQKRGVFATRSPHRPCPVGLSLVRVDRVVGDTVFVSGVDLIDGTPVLDIKPYIPAYDNPAMYLDGTSVPASEIGCDDCRSQNSSLVRVAPWLNSPPVPSLSVKFTSDAEHQLELFRCRNKPTKPSDNDFSTGSNTTRELQTLDENLSTDSKSPPAYILQTFSSLCAAKQAIVSVLQQDPRSVYRREKCSQETYKFSIDNLNITCQFEENKAVVIDIQPKTQWLYKGRMNDDDKS